VKKILLIRFSSIGDIVLTTPIIRTLKKQTGCELHVLTKKKYSQLFFGNPSVSHIYAFEKSPDECMVALLKENFDVIIDLQKNFRALKVKRHLGVTSYSFPKLNMRKWLLVNTSINQMPDLHLVDRYFMAVKELGVTNDNLGLDFFIPEKEEVNPLEIASSLSNGYIAMVIGGQHLTKIFLPEKAAELISRLALPVVLLGGPEDKQRGDEMIRLSQHAKMLNTCGTLSLNQSASFVRQAKLVITNDTGLMHIAAAFSKPILSIWGNTVPEFGMYPYMPGKEHMFEIAQVAGLSCRPCSKLGFSKCPKKHFKCMRDQDIDRMVEQSARLLDQSTKLTD
jgi:ADP-heptose:LPS heptosyltransferase